jgi:hypothetical protein
MLHFILQTLIMLALGVMIYLMAAALPRIGDEAENAPGQMSRAMAYIEKADEIFRGFWEKMLRRVRVWILRLDNLITKKLGRFKKEAGKESKLPLGESGSSVDKDEEGN